jgi:glutamine---fructose-6-phosphate transaminase (isomerizing)
MCGIVGFTGNCSSKEILINGLKRLEYRGYDSAGIAVQQDGCIEVVREIGKVAGLEAALTQVDDLHGTCGVGHTRWATHGRPAIKNAHPHVSCDGGIAVVHNGIIENFMELREELISQGHTFKSDTDTEVFAHLIEREYAGECKGDLLASVREAVSHVIGTYGLAVIAKDQPGTIIVTRHDSPIVLAHAKDGSYVASDMIAVIDATRDIAALGDRQFAVLSPDEIKYYDAKGNAIDPEITHVDWDIDAAEKGGFPDFMKKEIYEQPRVIRDTLAGRLVNGELCIDELSMSVEELNLIDRVYVIACGTSYHAGLIAKTLIESWVRIPTEVRTASEFRYGNPIITPTTLVVAVSQSGETADTLAAIRDARVRGAKVFGITNVIGSEVARESDGVIYTKANKEIAVASTKSFLGQVVSLTLLAMLLAQAKGRFSTKQIKLLFSELANTAQQVEQILSDTSAIKEAANAFVGANSAFYIGRGMGLSTCYEGALKLKEISYVHAEAYPAGEMKHGPIALIDKGFPVVALVTHSPVYDKTVSNIEESRSRGAKIIAIATQGDEEIKKHADYVIYIPKVRDCFSPITASVPLQLLARYVAKMRGCDIDQPRNLAKSVTVE